MDQSDHPAAATVGRPVLSWPLIVALLTMAGMLGYVRSELLADPDTYWHIAAGRWILEHGTVPSADPFSYSMPGAPWIAHEWLSEVLLAVTYALAGWAGPVVLAVFAFAATLAYMTRFLLSRLAPIRALFLVALVASMLFVHLFARPHVLAWPFMALWVGSLVQSVDSRQAPPWWSLLLIVVWANLHGGVSLGVALGVPLALEAVLAAPSSDRAAALRSWGAFVALSVVAMMVTPFGWKSIWFTFHMFGTDVPREAINEWKPTDFGRHQPLELWLLLVLGIALAGRLRLHWLRLLVILGLVHLALTSVRNATVLGLVSPLLAASALATGWRDSTPEGRGTDRLDRFFEALAPPARLAGVALASLVGLAMAAVAVGSGRYAPSEPITPKAAVDAALAAGARGPVLNDYAFGGYLIFRGIPVFIDGRADLYRRAFLIRSLDAIGDQAVLASLLEEYRIGWTLLRPDTPAVSALDATPCWRRVHADKIAVAHLRGPCPQGD